MIRIVTDGTIDMPPDWEQTYNIHIMPLRLHFGNDSYTQGVDLSRTDFYRLVTDKGVFPKTTLPSPQQLIEFYRSIANPGDEIITMHISGKLSGTFDVVKSVVDELREELDITPFDSEGGSAVLGFMCREARIMEQAGAGVREIMARMAEIRSTMGVVFTIDRLDFARMSGRVTFAKSILSSVLNIKPVIILKDGLLEMGEVVRTRKRALEKVVEECHSKMGNQLVNLAVVHAIAPEAAQELMGQARRAMKCCVTMVADLATPIAAHLGPGALGIVCYPASKEIEG